MSERKRRRVEEDARRLELCADDLRELGASIGSYLFRAPTMHVSVPLQTSSSSSKPRNTVSKSPSVPSRSLYSLVSSAAYAAKTNASGHPDTWQTTLHRLAREIAEKNGSKDAIERYDRLKRRFDALSDSVRLHSEKVRKTGDEVALQNRMETQLAQEETAWEQQMQTREQRVAEREVELQVLKEENEVEQEETRDSEQEQDEEEEEEDVQVELAELQEAVALRAEEKRDIEAAIDSLQRKKTRRQAVIAEERKKREAESVDVEGDAAAAAREQVVRELREEKDALQREIIAAEETEENLDENLRDLPALKEKLAEIKKERSTVQSQVDSLRLELARRKRKMRHMVDVQLLTARDTNPPTLREEAVLLHLLYEHEGEMGVNELKQEASTVLEDHGKPNGNGVVIRALYSLVANGVVQIDRSYGNGLVTSLLV
ncbi:hypothetical protein JG687_00009603 [Phytophthora cactorum]|uniref:Uncharacterized protein n=1 Tax=Phytophthora cactorum TaxID=29920 RepID=A0A329SFD9_9STRA|nr:hypothetical protein Pcac1_g15732 [Phytophthora cactorum]KAG2811972.1 hypothetical protein PC111_g15005 [Phytophthora cactorum]KAG2820491.1 hypothetical protein PC112_g11755 [Phytophthora cactorum]KAG2851223.1 hypothetical protein PC113_g16098 [Phytophthora cactorum]KAG2890040.1 hypothetical protein PC114_g17676 [Phytophthora cactorum]